MRETEKVKQRSSEWGYWKITEVMYIRKCMMAPCVIQFSSSVFSPSVVIVTKAVAPEPYLSLTLLFIVQSWSCQDFSKSGFPVLHHLPEFAQTNVHWVSDAIQPSHSLSPPSLPAFNLSQHQGLFQWISSSHQVAKVLELQLQHQSFQWIFRTNFF